MVGDSLGDRMKAYEAEQRSMLSPHSISVLRVDGRAFHSWTRGLPRPFDMHLAETLDATARALCSEIQGAVLAHSQSDEISVIFADLNPESQPWFGGVIQKQVSIAAALASVTFNAQYPRGMASPALFDARVFTVPSAVEAANYLIWRQRDCMRNSVSMAAQAAFSHKKLQGKGTRQMRAMLDEAGKDWGRHPQRFRMGGVTMKQAGEQEVTYVDKRDQQEKTTTAMRSWWETTAALEFSVQGLLDVLPDREAITA
ncbi:tRNA(His) guanylyltransferase Thg1 family protein [Kineosporia babensis]|uniref:tRNA(His) guanylyltransferase Thg1 family protein n=1 Tax=Kineosporia babensis TaxID=499548 RepID=A0A9X1SSP4_9ACTN|nr:tRNA(His) guanylyltransferase Thg1 family protein [Kineosporia babensis]MCD5310794.1 tRNA(His) guanylyltransferase Thg1 family protein [Kineosporia babensis]